MAHSSPVPRLLAVRRLGLVSYADGVALQSQLVDQHKKGEGIDTLLLLEHPPVITLGSRTRSGQTHIVAPADVLAARGVTVTETARGGDVTFHGPGQLIAYPILDLKPDRCDVHAYVRDLEEVVIRVAADFGISAHLVLGLTGVWVGEDKLAAIGVRISRWVTHHGFALNVSTDLSYFDLIVPCGIVGRGVTSLERILGQRPSLREVEDRVIHRTTEVFGYRLADPLGMPHSGSMPQEPFV